MLLYVEMFFGLKYDGGHQLGSCALDSDFFSA